LNSAPASISKSGRCDVLEWIKYAYLLRFQVAAALVMAVGLPVAYYLVPSVFVGLFDAMGFTSFLFVVWAAFQGARTITVLLGRGN